MTGAARVEDATAPTSLARTTERPGTLTLLGWTAFVLLLVYATVIGGGHSGIQLVALRTISLGLIAAGLAVWALLALRRAQWRPRTAIWPALVLPFVALAVATLLSPFPRLGLDYVAWTALLIGLYLFLVRIMAFPYARERIGRVVAWLALLMGVAYIGIVVASWFEWWSLLGRLTAPMLRPAYTHLFIGGPTVVAPVIILMASVGLAGLDLRSRSQRLMAVGLVVVTSLTVILTGTRAAWAAFGVVFGLMSVAWAVANRDRLRQAARARRVRLVLVGAAAVVLPIALLLGPALAQRLTFSNDGGRGIYLTTAWRMFESAPLTGQGPGNWVAQRHAFTLPGEPDIYVPHAHDIYLQTLAETGLVGGIAGLVAVAAVAWLLVGALRGRGRDPMRRRWAWAALFSLGYLAVHSLVDWYANVPLIIMLAALPLAVVDATSERGIGLPARLSSEGARSLRVSAAVGVFAMAFTAFLVLSRTEAVAQTHEEAVLAIDTGAWADAAEPAAAAAAQDPDMVAYQMTSGLAAAATGDWGAAEAAFAAAARVDDLPQTWLDLALARLESGRPADEVVEALERALRVGDQHPRIVLAAAHLYDRLGMRPAADAAYARAIAAHPSIAADPTWSRAPMDAERLGALVEEALVLAGSPWEVALMAGDEARARTLAQSADAARPDLAALVIDAWSGDPEAVAATAAAALEQPRDAEVVAWAARVSARAGDAAQAARFRRIAEFENESFVPTGYETRIWVPGTDLPPGALPPDDLYGQHVYRRPTPGELLAPGLPVMVQVDLAAAGEGDR